MVPAMGVASALSGKLLGSALWNTHVVLALAGLFLALAASMFGAFEIALASGINNKLSTVGGVGYKGAFVMGLVMGLIAAPCTGPFITGMVVYVAQTKSIALGCASFFSFSLGRGVMFCVAGGFAGNRGRLTLLRRRVSVGLPAGRGRRDDQTLGPGRCRMARRALADPGCERLDRFVCGAADTLAVIAT